MSKVVRVYDPGRNPPEWSALLTDSQVAVFVEDAHRELPLGRSEPTCEIFDDLPAAEAHCQELIERDPSVRCLIFDRSGRGGSPPATYESPTQPQSAPQHAIPSLVLSRAGDGGSRAHLVRLAVRLRAHVAVCSRLEIRDNSPRLHYVGSGTDLAEET